MKNRYGSDGMTFSSILDTSIGKIEIFETSESENHSPSRNLPNSSNFNNNISSEEAKKVAETFFKLY
jgi:hypothetical protein